MNSVHSSPFHVSSSPANQKRVIIKVKGKQAALVTTAKDKSCVLCLANEIHLERSSSTELVCSVSSARIGVGIPSVLKLSTVPDVYGQPKRHLSQRSIKSKATNANNERRGKPALPLLESKSQRFSESRKKKAF